MQNDENNYAQQALDRVYTMHRPQAASLCRHTNAALTYQLSDLLKSGPIDLCWIIFSAVKHRSRPLTTYLSSILDATIAKNKNSDRHHNMIVELTHVGSDTKLDEEEDLGPAWRRLLGDDKMCFPTFAYAI